MLLTSWFVLSQLLSSILFHSIDLNSRNSLGKSLNSMNIIPFSFLAIFFCFLIFLLLFLVSCEGENSCYTLVLKLLCILIFYSLFWLDLLGGIREEFL